MPSSKSCHWFVSMFLPEYGTNFLLFQGFLKDKAHLNFKDL